MSTTLLRPVNCLGSSNGSVAQRTAKIDAWKNSNQQQRWLAAVLLDIKPRLRRIRGYGYPAGLLAGAGDEQEARGEEDRVEEWKS